MPKQTDFNLSELPDLEFIRFETHDFSILMLGFRGEIGVTGYLELQCEASGREVDCVWKWTVNEPAQNEAYQGHESELADALEKLRANMADMAMFIRNREEEEEDE